MNHRFRFSSYNFNIFQGIFIIKIHNYIEKSHLRPHSKIDKIFCKNVNNIFQIQNYENFKTDFFHKPIDTNISHETSFFKKLLLLWVVSMTFTLIFWIFWPRQCLKFTQFLYSCIMKMS